MERWRVGIQSVQVRVKREVGKRFPRWLISLNLQRRHADGALVSHGAAGNHGNAMHAPEAQFTPVLKKKALRSIRSFTEASRMPRYIFALLISTHDACKIKDFRNYQYISLIVAYYLFLHLLFQSDRLFLILAPLVLKPYPDHARTQSGHLDELFLHERIRARVRGVASSESVQLLLIENCAHPRRFPVGSAAALVAT